MAGPFGDFLLSGNSTRSSRFPPYILLLPQGPPRRYTSPQQIIQSNVSAWGTIGGGPVKILNSIKDKKVEYMCKNTRDYNAFTGGDSNMRMNIINVIVNDSSLFLEKKKVHEEKEIADVSFSSEEGIKHCVHISFNGSEYPFKIRKIVMERSKGELFGKDKSNKDLLRTLLALVKTNIIF